MDAQLLNELIENPEKATIEQALLVHELVVKYPYFQSARVLHLKLLSLSDYPAFLKELPQVATYAGDRKKLYHYLHPEKKVSPQVAPEVIEMAPGPVEDHENPEGENDEKVEPILPESAPEQVEVFQPEEEVAEPKETEVKEEAIEAEGPEQPSETLSFAQWLDSLAEQGAVAQQAQTATGTSSASRGELETPEADMLNRESVSQSAPGQGGLTDERWSLIDSFLREYKPSTPKSEAESTVPKQEMVDLSTQKQEPEKEIITETLAEIFLAQKNYKKAIEIFEKLRLKYPEKNVYFADLIKKAKRQRKKDNKKTK